MTARKLTDRAIANLPAPAPKDGKPTQTDYRDSLLPGFAVRVSSSGTRTFVLIRALNGKRQRWTLGRYGDTSLADAREKAREYGAAIAKGVDAEIEAKRIASVEKAASAEANATTFASVRERFLTQHGRKLKPDVLRRYEGFLRSKHVADWDTRPLASLTRREIVERFDAIAESAPIMANRGLAYLKSLVSFAIDKSLLEVDITARVRKPAKERKRDRVLTDDEIKRLWLELRDSKARIAPIASMLLLTGQRREEIAGLRWSEVLDLDGGEPRIEIAGARMKNALPHVVPLSGFAASIVLAQPRASDYVFGGRNGTPFVNFHGAKANLDERLQLAAPWTLHDLRRTVVTGLNNLGVAPHVVEAVVGHVGAAKAGVAGVYNRAQYLGERRVALQRWSDHILTLVEGRPSNVVSMVPSGPQEEARERR